MAGRVSPKRVKTPTPSTTSKDSRFCQTPAPGINEEVEERAGQQQDDEVQVDYNPIQLLADLLKSEDGRFPNALKLLGACFAQMAKSTRETRGISSC